jgi:hypothetical protein
MDNLKSMPTAVELPAEFRSIPEFSNAVDSGLNAVTSGLQAAGSAITEITDSLDSFAACFPLLGESPQQLNSISDAGALSTPETYLADAQQAVGKEALSEFSDLTSLTDVSQKLSDPNFDFHESLQSFSDLLSNLNFGGGFQALFFKDAASWKQTGDSPAFKDIGEAAQWKRAVTPGGISEEDALAWARAVVPNESREPNQASEVKDPGDAVDWKEAVIPNEMRDAGDASEAMEPANTLQDAPFSDTATDSMQRLFDFGKTLQEILTLNQW